MSAPLVLAIDGGNSKTDLVLVRGDGEVLALARGPLSSPHHVGLEGALQVIDDLLAEALDQAGIENGKGPVADVGQLLLAGVDFPSEVEQMQEAAGARGFARSVSVGNDTLAVLRAGTEHGWGVAIVCGAGINCVGVAPDGRQAGFPALGSTTGDWGGGYDVGVAAVMAAARSEDGRGAKTTLERVVPEHFGLETPMQLAEEIHAGRIGHRRAIELAPVVFAEAKHDAEAGGDRRPPRRGGRDDDPRHPRAARADAGAGPCRARRRADAVGRPAPDRRGQGGPRPRRAGRERPRHRSPPIVGAALLGLDQLGAGAGAQERLRRELGQIFTNPENPPVGRARPGRSRR